MRLLVASLLAIALFPLACTKTQTEVRYAAPHREYRLKRIPDSSLVRVSKLATSGLWLRGTIEPSEACQRVPVNVVRRQTVEVKRGDLGKNGLLLASGVAATALSALTLHASGDYTNAGLCDVNTYDDVNGQRQEVTVCDSPRSTARFLSTVGVVAGGATMTAGTIGLLRRPSTKLLDETSNVEDAGAPVGRALGCVDQESLAGIELALEREGLVVGSGTVAPSGAFKVKLTEECSGDIEIVVVSVPVHLKSLLPRGSIVARQSLTPTDDAHERPEAE